MLRTKGHGFFTDYTQILENDYLGADLKLKSKLKV